MSRSVSEQCQTCVTILGSIVSTTSDQTQYDRQTFWDQANDHLERFGLWVGNTGALHGDESPSSVKSRLRDEGSVLAHVQELLDDLAEVAEELLELVSGCREREVLLQPTDLGSQEPQCEETRLLEEIGDCIHRLFRISSLTRQAARTDLFEKALSQGGYRFKDHFDIAHVGEKFAKLATEDFSWLRKRLGQSITKRRHYLSYMRDQRGKLEGVPSLEKPLQPAIPDPEAPIQQLSATQLTPDSADRPSTISTKASTLQLSHITVGKLQAVGELDSVDDSRSYTTISCSIQEDVDTAIMGRIPNLEDLPRGLKKEVECPFCYHIEVFKNEKTWRRHVFSDLRSYVCTSPECDGLYFADLNDWFRHEMDNHRVSYACRLCQSKTFDKKDHYLAHIKKHHPQLLKHGEENLVLQISQQPMEQIPAQDCPCCSDWVYCLKARAGLPSDTPDETICVTPPIFMRHLASHLEQLALFAIPINSGREVDADSNVDAEANAQGPGEHHSPNSLFFRHQSSFSLPSGSAVVGGMTDPDAGSLSSRVPPSSYPDQETLSPSEEKGISMNQSSKASPAASYTTRAGNKSAKGYPQSTKGQSNISKPSGKTRPTRPVYYSR